MANSALVPKERRSEQRTPTHFDLTHYLKASDSQSPVRCILTDVSANGIGIRSLDYLKPETILLISFGVDAVELRVAWSKPMEGKVPLWQVGLTLVDATLNLKTWLVQHGPLQEFLQTRATPKADDRSQPVISFAALRKSIAKVHTADYGFFKEAVLVESTENCKAFPLNFEGRSLVAILPRELKPQQLNDLSEEAAASSILICERAKASLGVGRWEIIWPMHKVKAG